MKTFASLTGYKKAKFDYIGTLATKLNSHRKEGKHCDATLIHGKKRFPVHTAVLCAANDYFSSLLDGSFSEGQQKDIDLTESFPTADTLETVLEYIYTGDLYIHDDNFEDLLEGVHLIMLDDAVKLIAEYLADSLVLENCIEIFTLSSKFEIEDLLDLSTNIVNARLHDFLYYNDREKLYALPPDLIENISQGFSHLTTEEVVSFLKKYILDLLHDQAEHSKALLLSCKSMLLAFKEHSQRVNSTENHVSKFCGSLVDILTDDLIDENPQTVSEKLCNIIGNEKDNSSKAEHNQDFEEAVLIRTEEYTNEQDTKYSFYAYLTVANKWIEIAEPGHEYRCDARDGDMEPLKHLRFVGFSEGHIIFTPSYPNKEQSGHVVAFCISPDIEGSAWLTSYTSHSCLVYDFASEYVGGCSHHIFTSRNQVFCIYPKVCCTDAARHEANHRPEIGAYKVELMDWRDHDDSECPEWNDVGTLELPSSFRTRVRDRYESYHSEDGNFSKIVFLIQERPSCTHIIALGPVYTRNYMYDDISKSVFAVFKMNQATNNSDFSFELLRSGTLYHCWSVFHLHLCAGEKYLMMYSVEPEKCETWTIDMSNFSPSERFSSDIYPVSLTFQNYSEDDNLWTPKALKPREGMPSLGSMHAIASTHNGNFYGLVELGPYLICQVKITEFEPPEDDYEIQTDSENESDSGSTDSLWYPKEKISLPAPPIDQDIKDINTAVVPKGLIEHLRGRPKVQFKNTRADASAGPYFHEDFQVIDKPEESEDEQPSDQDSNFSI